MENILERIYKSGLKLLVPSTPEKAYETIVSEAMKLVDADIGTIHLESNGVFRVVYSTSLSFYKINPRKRGNTYKTFVSGKPRIVNTADLQKVHPAMRGMKVSSSILIPLSYQHKAIGVLSVDSKKIQKFTDKELEILVLFGSMASLAIRKTQLYDETRRALETRDLFISMAAHELRTPLTTISGYVQLLKNKFKDNNITEKRWLDELTWETFRLTKLVNELLSVSKISTGELSYSLKEKSLKEIVRRAITNFKLVYPDRSIEFSTEVREGKDHIIGDFDKLLQAIDNILDNAAKFSPPGSKIAVILKSEKPCWLLQVKDQGKGIKKEDLPKVFENYYRGGHTTEGMGLGLYLAKNIIEKHHGEIEIKSKPQKGTKVIIKLPKAKL